MKNLVFAISMSILALTPCAGQSMSGWRGLHFGSAPEEVVKIMGPAKKDQLNQKLVVNSARGAAWLSVDEKEKIYRKMIFDKPEGFAEAKLFFRDNKLVAIELQPKYKSEAGWLDPDDLASAFKVDFKPHNAVFGGKPLGTPQEFGSNGDPATKLNLHAFYEMIAVAEDSFIFASVDNREPINLSLFGGSNGRRESKDKEARDTGGEFPGYVTSVQIFSRTISK